MLAVGTGNGTHSFNKWYLIFLISDHTDESLEKKALHTMSGFTPKQIAEQKLKAFSIGAMGKTNKMTK